MKWISGYPSWDIAAKRWRNPIPERYPDDWDAIPQAEYYQRQSQRRIRQEEVEKLATIVAKVKNDWNQLPNELNKKKTLRDLFVGGFALWRIQYATLQNEEAFRLHVKLEDLIIEGNNSFHERMIRLQGSVFRSSLKNIIVDCVLQTSKKIKSTTYNYVPRFDTLVLHVDDGDDVDFGSDVGGFQLGVIESVHAGQVRSAFHKVFQERINHSSWRGCFADGTFRSASFDFRNSLDSEFQNLATEGRGDKPIFKLTNCHGLTFKNIGIGDPAKQSYAHKLQPNGKIPGYEAEKYTDLNKKEIAYLHHEADRFGNGIELYGCSRCLLDGRSHNGLGTNPGRLYNSIKKTKLVVMDGESYRNVVQNFETQIPSGDVSELIQIENPKWNYASIFAFYYGHAHIANPNTPGTMFYFGTPPMQWPSPHSKSLTKAFEVLSFGEIDKRGNIRDSGSKNWKVKRKKRGIYAIKFDSPYPIKPTIAASAVGLKSQRIKGEALSNVFTTCRISKKGFIVVSLDISNNNIAGKLRQDATFSFIAVGAN